MSINIDHSHSGNVTLMTSNVIGDSTLIFPNINGESFILVSGHATVDSISGLRDCINSSNAFVKDDYSFVSGNLVQTTSGTQENRAYGSYSIALGCNACANYSYQIAHAVDSSGNLGWNQSSQYINKVVTVDNTPCLVFPAFKVNPDSLNTISYLDGSAVARGNGTYAAFNFCAVSVIGDNLNEQILLNKTITTPATSSANLGFFVDVLQNPSGQKYVSIRVSGDASTTLNWLVCMNELKLKTS
jgi:hypothetical protein